MGEQFVDQMGNVIKLASTQRIVSLVPSQTELLFDLGLDEEIVGITKFCIYPKEKCVGKVKIGGTKKFNFSTIDALAPDLIVGNKEENYKEGIDALRERYPVWMSDILDLKDAYSMIEGIGMLVGKKAEAMRIISEIDQVFARVVPKIRKSALYLIWQDPYMGVGSRTFIHEMMQKCGFENVLEDRERYPVLTIEDIIALAPEVILLSSEPYPFKEKHRQIFEDAFPFAKTILVDGEMFSWYGSRLRYAPAYFDSINI